MTVLTKSHELPSTVSCALYQAQLNACGDLHIYRLMSYSSPYTYTNVFIHVCCLAIPTYMHCLALPCIALHCIHENIHTYITCTDILVYIYICIRKRTDMYTYMYTYICMYMYMHACMDGYKDGWMDGWIQGWMDGWMDERMYACMHVCMCVCMHERMYICMYVCRCLISLDVYLLDFSSSALTLPP